MKITVFIFLLNIFYTFSYSQVYREIVIDDSGDPNEPAIVLNPNNTNEIVAGANIDSYYYSRDGGYTWNEGTLQSTNGVWGDPAIACDSEGNFYFFHLSNAQNGVWIDRIVCQKSVNGGQSWNNGSYTGLNGNKQQDKQWATVDRANNNIYVTWTQFDEYGSSDPGKFSNILFSKSLDSGANWSSPIQINQISGDCIDSDNTTEGAFPAVSPNGEIYVAWAGKKTNGENAILFDKSSDGGDTWLNNDIVVTDFPGGWDYNIPGISRCNGLPILKCDTSGGTYNGTLYINWTDQENGTDDTDVWLIKSIDGGETWSNKIRVNNDSPSKHQFLTWMDIDQTNGKLYFIFYDRRNYSDTKTDVYLAISDDGGETFENVKISESPFVPNVGFFGDYTNISVYDGKIAPIWARADGGHLSIRTIVPDNSGINTADNNLFAEKVFPNPSKDKFYYSFKIRRKSVISLSVTDIFGKEIYSFMKNKVLLPGKYTETFNAEKNKLASGMYFFVFSDKNGIKTRKIIYKKR